MRASQRFHLNRLADKLVTPERFGGDFAFPPTREQRAEAWIRGRSRASQADLLSILSHPVMQTMDEIATPRERARRSPSNTSPTIP
jgi:hypothetical protein